MVRADGEPLEFQLRLPEALELVDLARLIWQAPGAPASLGQVATTLQRGADAAGAVVVGALRPTTVPEAERQVLATLTVAFVEMADEPALDDLLPASGPTARSHMEVTRLSDTAIRVTRHSAQSPGEGRKPVPVLVIQYLLRAPYGALVIAFSTTNREMMGDRGRALYGQIVDTAFIGECSRPY